MRRSMEEAIKKLRGRSIIAPIIACIFSIIGSALLIGIVVMALLCVILVSRFNSSSYSSATVTDKIISEHQQGKDYDQILDEILNQERRPLSVSVVNDEKIISSYGEKVNLKEAKILENARFASINISIDSPKEFAKEAKSDELHINIEHLVREISENIRDFDSYMDSTPFMEEEIYRYEFWIKTPVTDSEDLIYVKYELNLLGIDFVEMMIVGGMLSIFFVIGAIGRMIHTISEIFRQRYYLKLILSDPVTGGNNEFAFEYTAFGNIVAYRNRKKGFAIIDMSIAKYQNYCTLYGVAEGERFLSGVERFISRSLHRGETVSRVTNGDYLILLQTDKNVTDEAALIARANNIISSLPEKLNNNYSGNNALQGITNVRFIAGMYYLPPVTDEDSKQRRDKNKLNIKNLCIKAGMAKNAIDEDNGFMVYNHEMWEKEIWERKVEDMMDDALANEEFQVYIQPKYDPTTEELKGGEALVRWISPTEGFISPGQFIPIFEKTGFVTKLDDYMISHTAKLQADWLASGKKIVPISVNVSRAHFAQEDLAEHIRDLVDAYPLPHEYIEIELTESAFFDDKNALLTTVHRLQEYGFEVSMDDFGSGYSSLNSLKDLPLNVLKLDAEFFRGDDFGGRGEIVVSEAISLAKQLNMRIVAEGVEKKEQVDFLASQKCDMIQGYYFAKPMPATEYESRMQG